MRIFIAVLLCAISYAQTECVDDNEAALVFITPLVELGALRFFGVDTNCVLAVAAITDPPLCEMEDNPCCQTCEDYANSDFHDRIMLNKRYLHIDTFFGGVLSNTNVEDMNTFIDTVAVNLFDDDSYVNREGLGQFYGARNMTESFTIWTPWLNPNVYWDASQACTTSPFWPQTNIDINSELVIRSRTPGFPTITDPFGPDREDWCVEFNLDYYYASKDDVAFKSMDVWVVDKSDVARVSRTVTGVTDEELCDKIMQGCTEENQQYEDHDDCVQYHRNMDTHEDLDPALGCMTFLGHQRTCHAWHAEWPYAGIRPEIYCERLGKEGSSNEWCNFNTCDPDYYPRTCYEAAYNGNGMATLKWTQEGVDYDGDKADKLADIRGDSQAGDRVTQRQMRRIEAYFNDVYTLSIVECEYHWGGR